jgi:hypothetical protein
MLLHNGLAILLGSGLMNLGALLIEPRKLMLKSLLGLGLT